MDTREDAAAGVPELIHKSFTQAREPGGGQYDVFVLDDTNERREIVKRFGPYQSK